MPNPPAIDEAPPFLKSWRRIYLLVLLYLFAVIVVLWLITSYFTS